MNADFAVELGAEDEVLEFPWSAPEQGLRYYDLRDHPEFLAKVQEAQCVPKLAEFLTAVNSRSSLFETVKCDVWCSSEMNPEEEVFRAAVKCGSYIDLVFVDESRRLSLSKHQQVAQGLIDFLARSSEIPASAEFLIRRCYYHYENEPDGEGFYVTFYLFGYGSDEGDAKHQWAIGLELVQHAILQISAN